MSRGYFRSVPSDLSPDRALISDRKTVDGKSDAPQNEPCLAKKRWTGVLKITSCVYSQRSKSSRSIRRHAQHAQAAVSVRGLSGKVTDFDLTNMAFDAKEHRSCADGRASTRHLHGITERAARCDTMKVPAESSGAVAR